MPGRAVRSSERLPQAPRRGDRPRKAPGPAAEAVLRLQSSVGNRATRRLLARYPDATAAKLDTGLDDAGLALALTGMSLPELEAFKNAVGADRLRELVVDGQLTGEILNHVWRDRAEHIQGRRRHDGPPAQPGVHHQGQASKACTTSWGFRTS